MASLQSLVLLKLMRLKSGIWVAAYLRRCNVEGVFAAVRRRGAEEVGALFIHINLLHRRGILYAPAPQAVFEDARPADRVFSVVAGRGSPAADNDIEARLVREHGFDPDLLIVEVEDRAGRNCLDNAVTDAN